MHNFDSDWERVNAFSHCVTLKRILLPQIIFYSVTKVPVLVVVECKRASVVHVYELAFLLHTSSSTEYRVSKICGHGCLKVHGLISQNLVSKNDASSPKNSWFQISFKSVKPFLFRNRLCILQFPIPYCVSLIMVTITSHIFINTFKMVCFPAVKFTRGNEKNISFLLIPISESLKII